MNVDQELEVFQTAPGASPNTQIHLVVLKRKHQTCHRNIHNKEQYQENRKSQHYMRSVFPGVLKKRLHTLHPPYSF